MSLEFGLDWRSYEKERMTDFILIKNIIAKKQKDDYNKLSFKNNGWVNRRV